MRRLLVLLVLLAAGFAAGAQAEDPVTTADTTSTLSMTVETTTTAATTITGETTTTGTTTTPSPATIPAGVTIGGVPVGDLTTDAAAAAVRAAFARPLPIRFHGHEWTAAPRWLATPSVAAAVEAAAAAAPGTAVPLEVTPRPVHLARYVRWLRKTYSYRPVNARLAGLHRLRPRILRAHVGREILPLATRRRITAALVSGSRATLVPAVLVLRPGITRTRFGPVIVIRRSTHRLFLYRGVRLRHIFPVATGQARYPTPLGWFSIATKQRNPWWYPPNTSWAAGARPIPPGPGNPLGTRWMGLSAGGVGIHGTPDATSVGYSASHGCIRMRIRDAEWLFNRVRIGTPVFIVRA